MTEELATRKKRPARKAAPIAAAPPVSADPVQALNYIITNHGTPELVRQAMEIANAYQDRRAAEVFGESLAGFQAECPPITKTRTVMQKAEKGGGVRYKFASLDDVDAVTRPILAKWKLSASGTISIEADCILVRWIIQCGSHKEPREFRLPKIAAAGIAQGVNPVQDMGAWMQYLRRYTYCMALNLIVTDEDSDANVLRDVLLLDEKQRKQLDDWIATGIVKTDGTLHKLTAEGLLKWLQGELPEAERSLDRLTQEQFSRILSTFKLKYEPK